MFGRSSQIKLDQARSSNTVSMMRWRSRFALSHQVVIVSTRTRALGGSTVHMSDLPAPVPFGYKLCHCTKCLKICAAGNPIPLGTYKRHAKYRTPLTSTFTPSQTLDVLEPEIKRTLPRDIRDETPENPPKRARMSSTSEQSNFASGSTPQDYSSVKLVFSVIYNFFLKEQLSQFRSDSDINISDTELRSPPLSRAPSPDSSLPTQPTSPPSVPHLHPQPLPTGGPVPAQPVPKLDDLKINQEFIDALKSASLDDEN